ncbi:MAG: Hsp20/alpha crystallin family protein [Chloroflexi bacterium]|nr:Hsp20/alpha crystallin family protein [Chloroflexota bacterium]
MTLYLTPIGRRTRRMMNLADAQNWANMVESRVAFPIDIKEENDAFVISAMLPGIKAEDLEISVVNEVVSIKGEYQREHGDGEKYLLAELPSGRFCRTINLPDQLDSAKAEASMDNGVLTLSIPKAEAARPKTIKVSMK